MKIIFAGTPSFAAFHLKLLLNSKHELAAVLTQPDRPSGRGGKPKPSPVKLLAEENQLQILQPESLKNNKEIIAVLEALKPDLILVVAYGLILPKDFINLPKLGCINVHASLLPKWRGAAPIERSILEGDLEGGLTYMEMDEGLDTGPIMKLVPCPISSKENSESLEKKYEDLSSQELLNFLESLSSRGVEKLKQDSSIATYANKIEKQETEIFWESESCEFIERKIRGLYPKYGAFTFLGKLRVKILTAIIDNEEIYALPGEIKVTEEHNLYAGCIEGKAIKILSLQVEGKKAISSEDFIRGNKERLNKQKRFTSSLEKNSKDHK